MVTGSSGLQPGGPFLLGELGQATATPGLFGGRSGSGGFGSPGGRGIGSGLGAWGKAMSSSVLRPRAVAMRVSTPADALAWPFSMFARCPYVMPMRFAKSDGPISAFRRSSRMSEPFGGSPGGLGMAATVRG